MKNYLTLAQKGPREKIKPTEGIHDTPKKERKKIKQGKNKRFLYRTGFYLIFELIKQKTLAKCRKVPATANGLYIFTPYDIEFQVDFI